MMRNLCARAALALLALGVLPNSTNAGTLTLAWDPSASVVAGYRVSYGAVSGNHTTTVDVGNRTMWQAFGLPDGQRVFFVVRAYDNSGNVSLPSNEVSAIVLGVTLTGDLAAPSPTGKPITWRAFASEGVNAEYQFFRFSQAQGTWSTVQAYSSSNTFTWTPASTQQGTYAIQVWSRVAGSSDPYQAYSGTAIFTISDSPLTVGALVADKALPLSTGTTITWTAQADGGPSPLEYKFYLGKDGGGWTMVQDYGANNKFSWTPAAADTGRWAVQVWVRRNGSGAVYDTWRGSGFFDVRNGPPAVATLTANVAFPAGTGQAITWKAVAAGGPGPLEYRFWRASQATGIWTSVQNYGTSSTYTWTPGSAEQGTYVLQVWARRQGSSAPYEAYLSTGYFQISNGLPVVTDVTVDRPSPYGIGAPITWRATATGGPGPLQYRFWLYDRRVDSWAIVQDYSSQNTFTWSPRVEGLYALMVGVRRAGSTARWEAYYASPQFSVLDPPPSVRSVVSDLASATIGTPVAWTAIAGGGGARLEYKFYMANLSTGVWTLAQDYSWDPTFKWVPLAGDEGTYALQVWVRRAGSTAPYDAYGDAATFVVR